MHFTLSNTCTRTQVHTYTHIDSQEQTESSICGQMIKIKNKVYYKGYVSSFLLHEHVCVARNLKVSKIKNKKKHLIVIKAYLNKISHKCQILIPKQIPYETLHKSF